MRTFAMLFAWLPVTMAYMGTGQPGGSIYIFWTLLLLGACINICAVLYRKASAESPIRIIGCWSDAINAAVQAEDLGTARLHLRAWNLFAKRGAQ